MELAEIRHKEFLKRFLKSHEGTDQEQLKKATTGTWGGEGGEGSVHKHLKEAVAENPVEFLGEEGLRLEKVEFSFGATGDRIDMPA